MCTHTAQEADALKKEFVRNVEQTADKADETVESSLDQAKSIAIDAGETIF